MFVMWQIIFFRLLASLVWVPIYRNAWESSVTDRLGALICSLKFLSIAEPNLNKSNTLPSMEYCRHAWAVALYFFSDFYMKKYIGLLVLHFMLHLKPLVHCQNIASLSLFYKHYFGRNSSELAELVLVPYSRSRSTRYSNIFNDFSVTLNVLVSFVMQLNSGMFQIECLHRMRSTEHRTIDYKNISSHNIHKKLLDSMWH